MPQDAPLVVGWAQDAFVLPAVLVAVLAAYPCGRFQPQHADREPFGQRLGQSAANSTRAVELPPGRAALQAS